MNWFYTLLAAVFFLSSVHASPPGNKDVTVTLFQWSFDSIAEECSFLGEAGVGYVEISPPQEHIAGPQWWTSYQPISYEIKGRLGNEEALKRMTEACHAAGVKVIADAVINHMAANDGPTHTKYCYPGLYRYEDFHHLHMSIDQDYGDRHKVQHGELVSLSDLDTASEYVRNRIAAYLQHLIKLGIDGFRIDAAKHIAAEDLFVIKQKVDRDDIFWVSEVIYGAGEAIHPEEYLILGDVDEFRFGRELKRIFLQGKLQDLEMFGDSWGFLSSKNARSFVDNWDTERNGSTLSYKNNGDYTLANLFMLAWPYGAPNIFSGYEFSDHDQGPPHQGKVKACFEDGYKCQHRWPQISNMVAFRNAAAGAPVNNWWSNGHNAIAFGRGDRAFVVINHEQHEITEVFQTSLPPGIYCDVQHATMSAEACVGPRYAIDEEGKFSATIAANEAIAFHILAKVP